MPLRLTHNASERLSAKAKAPALHRWTTCSPRTRLAPASEQGNGKSVLGASAGFVMVAETFRLRCQPIQIVAVVEVNGCRQSCGRVLAPLQDLITLAELCFVYLSREARKFSPECTERPSSLGPAVMIPSPANSTYTE